MLQQVYGNRPMKKCRLCNWRKCFHDWCESVDDDPYSGHPSMSTNKANVKHVPEIVISNRRKSVDQIASKVGISVGSCHTILHGVLNMCHICQHLVLWMLAHEHKETWMKIYSDLIDVADKDNKFLNNVITGDATWCFLYNPQKKQQSSEWKYSFSSPCSKRFWVERGKGNLYYKHVWTVKALSIMSLSLKVRLWIKICTLAASFTTGVRSEGDTPKNE